MKTHLNTNSKATAIKLAATNQIVHGSPAISPAQLKRFQVKDGRYRDQIALFTDCSPIDLIPKCRGFIDSEYKYNNELRIALPLCTELTHPNYRNELEIRKILTTKQYERYKKLPYYFPTPYENQKVADLKAAVFANERIRTEVRDPRYITKLNASNMPSDKLIPNSKDYDKNIKKKIDQNKSLKSIEFQHGITSLNLKRLIRSNPNIQHFNYIVPKLSAYGLKNAESINLLHTEIKCLKTLVMCRKLEHLKLENKHLPTVNLDSFFKALSRHNFLKSLEITGLFEVSSKGLPFFIKALTKHPNLKKLTLDSCDIGKDEGIEALAEVLLSNTCGIETLKFHRYGGYGVFIKTVDTLISAIGRNKSLTKLNYFDSDPSIGQFALLTDALMGNPNITRFKLYGPSRQCCARISELKILLERSTSLKELVVKDIDDVSLRVLADALYKNKSIATLKIRTGLCGSEGSIEITTKGLHKLISLLKENKTITTLIVGSDIDLSSKSPRFFELLETFIDKSSRRNMETAKKVD